MWPPGRYDAFWEEGLAAWDVAAGLLLVREAGGYVSDLKGGQTMLHGGSILATNGLLHAPDPEPADAALIGRRRSRAGPIFATLPAENYITPHRAGGQRAVVGAFSVRL